MEIPRNLLNLWTNFKNPYLFCSHEHFVNVPNKFEHVKFFWKHEQFWNFWTNVENTHIFLQVYKNQIFQKKIMFYETCSLCKFLWFCFWKNSNISKIMNIFKTGFVLKFKKNSKTWTIFGKWHIVYETPSNKIENISIFLKFANKLWKQEHFCKHGHF